MSLATTHLGVFKHKWLEKVHKEEGITKHMLMISVSELRRIEISPALKQPAQEGQLPKGVVCTLNAHVYIEKQTDESSHTLPLLSCT